MSILFMDAKRQDEIDTFYDAPDIFDIVDCLICASCDPDSRPTLDKDAKQKIANAAAQRHRDYYRGYPKAYHPLIYFSEGEYAFQCPRGMSEVYLSFPSYHVKYKQPVTLPSETGRTSEMPPLPGRTLAGRYNKHACKVFVR